VLRFREINVPPCANGGAGPPPTWRPQGSLCGRCRSRDCETVAALDGLRSIRAIDCPCTTIETRQAASTPSKRSGSRAATLQPRASRVFVVGEGGGLAAFEGLLLALGWGPPRATTENGEIKHVSDNWNYRLRDIVEDDDGVGRPIGVSRGRRGCGPASTRRAESSRTILETPGSSKQA